MGLRINTNISSLSAMRTLASTKHALDGSLERLASGSRINRAGDDAAGLAISENLRAQIRGLRQAKRNAQDGISLVQVTEGGLNEVSNMIIRLRELAIQAASDTIGDQERKFTDREFQALKSEIQRIADSTNYNGNPLLNGKAGIFEIQIGNHNNPMTDRIAYNAQNTDVTLEALGLMGESVSTKMGAQTTLSTLDDALMKVNSVRADLGAVQNRLQSTINSISVSDENLSAANSRIRDADLAQEVSDMTKNNILMQSGISVLGQANQSAQAALKLLS
ncbi:MAG: flagellin FliC [Bdellovibrionales bacterium]|nr:flagellin FliC [Bdellovibrionales bacterium]